RRAADNSLLVRVRAWLDAALARRRSALHVPQLAPVPLSPGLFPPHGSAHRSPAARGVPADARAAARRQPAREARPLPGVDRVVAAIGRRQLGAWSRRCAPARARPSVGGCGGAEAEMEADLPGPYGCAGHPERGSVGDPRTVRAPAARAAPPEL